MAKGQKGAIRPASESVGVTPVLARTQAPAPSTDDVGVLFTTQAQSMTNEQTPVVAVDAAPVLIPEPVAVSMPGFTPVKYIGKRAEHIEVAYATRLIFKAGESKWVPDSAAAKMLKNHKDVYAPGDTPTTDSVKATAKQNQKEDEDMQDLRDSISYMDKDSLAKFAKIHYQVDFDAKVTTAERRAKVIGLIDQYGTA